MKKFTMKQIAIAFGERIGQDVEPNHLRLEVIGSFISQVIAQIMSQYIKTISTATGLRMLSMT